MSKKAAPLKPFLSRYRVVAFTLMAMLAVVLKPDVLVPLARSYVRLSQGNLLPSHLPPFVVAALIAWVSFIGLTIAVLVIRQSIGQFRLGRRARKHRVTIESQWTELARNIGVDNRLVIIADQQVYAFCAGLLAPRIYASVGLLAMLTLTEVEAVLRHEANHLHRRDPLRLFLSELIIAILAPFPAIRTLYNRARVGAELAADRAALSVIPLPILASALVKVSRATSSPVPLASAGFSASEARIDALLGRSVAVPFERRDLLMTGLVMLAATGVLMHLASLPTCHICPTF